ncbi:MAG: wapA 1 [Bacteroidetes bacterium]|nr:wapA 1 [Bacteroidota bacterium]
MISKPQLSMKQRYKTYLPTLLLLLWGSLAALKAQDTDSLTATIPTGEYTVSIESGDTIYQYVPEKWELHPPATDATSAKSNLLKAATTKSASSYGVDYMDLSHIPTSYGIDNSKDIGEIGISQGSANGALSYSIPIGLYQASNGFNPTVQLAYSSMGGNGVAGYGWQIGGISSISVTNKNYYYDGFPAAASGLLSDAFLLDGTRLIYLSSSGSYRSYQSEQGNIKVQMYYSGNVVIYFKAYYPNGSVAVYGYESNSSARTSYPLTKMTDVLGNTVNYSYTESNNVYYVSEINYGGNSTIGNHAKVSFNYESRSDTYTVYVAGLAVRQDYRLKGISSYFNGQLLRTYTLNYTNGVSSLLKQVDCSAGDKLLNPLLFYYGENNVINSFKKGSVLLTSYFSNTSVPNLNLSKGKFTLNSSSDGLIEYPAKSTYGRTATKKNWLGQVTGYRYGSTYNSEQKLLVYDLSGGLSIPAELTADDGLLLLTAMDVDGDGKDELVKINSSSVTSSAETVTFNVYDMATSLGIFFAKPRYSFTASYPGVVEWSDLYSASFKQMLTGDFLGTGKQTVLTITYNKNIKGEDVQSWATLVDLDNKAKSTLYDKACFSLDSSDRLFVIDYDGDGKADLCHINSSGTKVYTFSATGSLSEIASYSLTKSLFSSREMLLGDVNGDGKTDLMFDPGDSNMVYPQDDPYDSRDDNDQPYYYDNGNTWKIYYSTGAASGFNYQTKDIVRNDTDLQTKFLLQDMNGDGRADLVVSINDTVSFYPSVNGIISGTPVQQTVKVASGARFTTGNVMNAWQMSQLFSLNNYELTTIAFTQDLQKEQLLTGVVTSAGVVNRHQYSNIQTGDYESAYSIGAACTYPYRNLSGNLNLLASSESYLSDNLLSGVSYNYTRGMIDLQGRGFSGFENVSAYDEMRSMTSTQTFDPANFGVLKTVDSPTMSASYSYNVSVGANKIALVTLANKTETDKLAGKTVASSYGYDTYGNPTSEVVNYGDGIMVTTGNDYNNLTGTPYVLGELYSQTVTSVRNGLASNTRKYIPSFDAARRLPLVVEQYANGNLVSQVTNTYTNGLLTQASTKSYASATALQTSYAYDNLGRLQRKTNPLGLYQDYAYDAYGQVASVTDHKGNRTSYSYDAWGRKLKTESPDGVVESLTLKWVGGSSSSFGQGTAATVLSNGNNDLTLSSPLSQGGAITAGNSITLAPGFSYSASSAGSLSLGIASAMNVTVPSSLADNSGGTQYAYVAVTEKTGEPATQTYIDALGREVRGGTMRFDGSYLYTDKQYDNLGRLQAGSLPFKGTSPTLWNTYTYDAYDRILSLGYASGKTDSYSYSGMSVTSTIDGVAKTTTKDASGKVATVSDPAGTIAYTYRPDGQPASITAPGDITTTFTYDNYGRRTAITDPSAGTKSYAYDDAGNLSQETDAEGRTTTYTYDGFNRMAHKEVVGYLATDYTYNSDGQLQAVSSGNGTGKAYTYDNLMRTTSEKETAPDGKWLQKDYTFSSGNVAAIAYTANTGSIATENYLYANGTLSEIKLDNATSIWKLTAENNLGMPTQATSGNNALLTRSYGYDAYGMPTSRSISKGGTALQSFGYSIDPATGNLNWRKDNIRNIQEDFTYDNLNRLTAFGSSTIAYDDKGNITDMSAVGQFAYGNSDKPYAVTGVTPYGTAIALRNQTVTYNGMMRPASISENGNTATFAYTADGERAKMQVSKNGTDSLARYYLGGQYEFDQTLDTTKEKLYLGGDSYSAAAVYVKSNSGSWQVYYIGRDYQGSIIRVLDANGSTVQELSYDPWGRLRNPRSQLAYAPGSEPVLFLDRGYTGHEHLAAFGLINMNARLYDPALGRFLSPDPYVQAPDFSQNFNRYSYCLNNPLRFTDPSGEWAIVDDLIVALVGGVINLGVNAIQGNIHSFGQGAAYFGIGAAGAWAGLYTGPVVAGGIISAGNSVVTQGFGKTGTWNSSNISWQQTLFDGIIGGITAGVGSKISGVLSPYVAKFINGFGGQAVQQGITQGVTGATSGFAINTGMSLLNGDNIGDALENGGKGALSGLAIGTASGMISGMRAAYKAGENPWTGEEIISKTVQDKYGEHALAKNRHGDLSLSNDQIIEKTNKLIMENRTKYIEGDNTMIGKVNGIEKSFKVYVKNGEIRSINMYPGLSNRQTSGGIIKYGNIKW